MKKLAHIMLGGGSGFCVLVLLLAAMDIRFNPSPSLPLGLYRWERLLAEEARLLERGNIVIFCPDSAASALALRRGYLKRGPCPHGSVPLGKPVVATAGDTVEVTPDGVWVNSILVEKSIPLEVDRKGRPLPVRLNLFVLSESEYFVFSTRVAGSFDSRYYGPVRAQQIVARAKPVWVLNKAE